MCNSRLYHEGYLYKIYTNGPFWINFSKSSVCIKTLGLAVLLKARHPFISQGKKFFSKKDFWIISDQVENGRKITAVQYNINFQTVLATVLRKNFPCYFFPSKAVNFIEVSQQQKKSQVFWMLEVKTNIRFMSYVCSPFLHPERSTSYREKQETIIILEVTKRKWTLKKKLQVSDLHSCLLQTSLDKAACVAAFLYELVHNILLVLHGREHATANKINTPLD